MPGRSSSQRTRTAILAATLVALAGSACAPAEPAAPAGSWRDDIALDVRPFEDATTAATPTDTDAADTDVADAADAADTADAADVADVADIADIADTRDAADAADTLDDADTTPPLTDRPFADGAWPVDDTTWRFRLRAPDATRVELWLYEAPLDREPVAVAALRQQDSGRWTADVTVGDARYYGYRLWGPNWPYDPAWTPGSDVGFVADVDTVGHRFNPNKLVVDPYALEWSHDPVTATWDDWSIYQSGPEHRGRDSGPVAPKGVLLVPETPTFVDRPQRALRDDIVYEVHVRGLTMNDPSVPEALRGTYAGAALKAPQLAALGVTAIELLPLMETPNEQNDREEGSAGDNYWGYASLSYFAPERRYASDRAPGGPTRELQAMVAAYHAVGIKVFVDVVYNHTAEGGSWGDGRASANVLSWRGVSNVRWYQTIGGAAYRNDNGVGPNLRFTESLVQDAVIDSLRYWHEVIGADGYRFDLASILGNRCVEDCFEYSADGLLTRIAATFARREDGTGVDLIAEPWGTGPGTYQLGNYPSGWHEWNDQFRIAIRQGQNLPDAVRPAELAMRIHGSSDRFRDDGRGPDAGVSYLVSHDGFTLADLYACADRDNDQPWPYGPSDGGSTFNHSTDSGGDPTAQRQAARTGLGIALLSAGIPMLTGGDEFLRSQRCNNNAYNLDSIGNWLDWSALAEAQTHFTFVQRMLAFRRATGALRPARWTEGADRDADGVLDIAWLNAGGAAFSGGAWDDPGERYLAWMLDGDETLPAPDAAAPAAIYAGWNRGTALRDVTLPEPPAGTRWFRVADTAAWLESEGNSHPADARTMLVDPHYGVHGQSLLVLVAEPFDAP